MIGEFWGKARPGGEVGAHPLLAHSLDVAAVAVLLAGRRHLGIDPRMLGFLVSLHDIGKYSRPFQAKARECWPVGALGPYPTINPPPGPAHDVVGLHFLSDVHADRLNDLLPAGEGGERGWKASDRMHLWRALAGHHGRPPSETSRVSLDVVCSACRDAAGQFLDAMRTIFQPPSWKRPVTERDVVRISWCIAGLTTLSDWIGSRQAWFPYVTTATIADPAVYFWGHALPRAGAALASAGLAPSTPAAFTGLHGLFSGIAVPSEIQRWSETVMLPAGPVLAVIEDLTGSGKTEAALTLAHRVLAEGRADGLYFALPTMATANAMFARLAASYRALFASDAHPSLALAHGRAALDARFVAAIESDGTRSSRQNDPADESAEAHCASWLAEDRRRALLAQVGVGTLDQALLAILPVRHATLRLQGIAGKVLIVDEAHAFDPYMREELATLLRFHGALGGSAILLSATLPHALRQKLVDAFRDGLGVPPCDLMNHGYPLATIIGGGSSQEVPCAPREGLSRRVTVTRLPNAAAAVERIAGAAAVGAAVVWIRNTVDDAIPAVALLKAQGIDPLLFHARYAMADRLAIEQEVLRRFGRGSENRNCVLVATQVVEQSLDIDFDLMVTDLAPADLLIQRAGRLWRHDRGVRCLAGPELLIVSPEPIDTPPANWIMATLPGTGSVYPDHALLWRSARAVFGRGAIVTPDDMRPIIEEVFNSNAEGAVPPALSASADDAYSRELSHVGIALQNVLDIWKGYRIDAGSWEPDTRTPTRLEDRPHITLRLAQLQGGEIVPYAHDADPRRAWALSEVLVARYRIASCPLPPELDTAAVAAKSQWGKWERKSEYVLLALLTGDGDGYVLNARSERGAAVTARYDARTGLSWSGSESAQAG